MTHDSDCSLHNGPALPVGPCDCSVAYPQLSRQAIKLLKQIRTGQWPGGALIGMRELIDAGFVKVLPYISEENPS